jgi:lon-related putative ATP-dependent protease
MDIRERELKPEQLRPRTDPSLFHFLSTAELQPLEQVIGQERAVRSIDFGVDMPSQGYNIFAVGASGSGRTTAVHKYLHSRAIARPAPAEWCYVYNFDAPQRPLAVNLPAGRAAILEKLMAQLVSQLRREFPRTFEGEHYEQRRRELMLEMQAKQQPIFQELEHYLNERGFALIRSQAGLTIAPMIDGEVLTSEAYQKLDPEVRQKFEEQRPQLQEQFDRTMRNARELDRQAKLRIENINGEMAGYVVDNLMAEVIEAFSDCPRVKQYLTAVRQDIVSNVGQFVPSPDEEASPLALFGPSKERWYLRYQVNVLASTGSCPCAPVIIEDNPTYPRLIGRIEHHAELGAMVTDFTQIRAGALHRANGGYLVVEAKTLLINPLAWDGLKRALRTRAIKIEEMGQFYGMVSATTLDPEPIPLDIKVVLIGEPQIYQLLHAYDEDFRELFKVQAQFAATMPRDQQTAEQFALLVGNLCRDEGLRPFGPEALAQVIDESSRLADDQVKVTTRFGEVADIVREASHWAGRGDHPVVLADDVRTAVAERTYRLSYAAERTVEMIQEGLTLIATDGEAIGQINGLSVVQTGNYAFGIPSRITARTFLGRAGVVSIDREVKMSGPIHDKGQLILSSYLASCFAQKRPLSMSATLTFEQLYSGVEGDSASSTELYALLSALADAPIKQSLAVTGSVNQFGQVQPIGGVNEKLEGFFDACSSQGLTGEQGALIPASNVRHLMLREDVVEAVKQGRFHICAVSRIEEGIELLTGRPAGAPNEEGEYPEGSVYAAVAAKLAAYADASKEHHDREPERQDDDPIEPAKGQRDGDGQPDGLPDEPGAPPDEGA